MLTDVFGATPSQHCHASCSSPAASRAIAGVNLPMLLRALTYRDKDMETLITKPSPAAATACLSEYRSSNAKSGSRKS